MVAVAKSLLSFWLLGLVVTAPTSPDTLALHEQRYTLHKGIDRRRIEGDALLPMRIGLKQNDKASQNAVDWLMAVSQPDSPQYGQHWSQEEVIKAFQPTDESISAVKDWLSKHGIRNATHTNNKQWIAFDVPAAKAEAMLGTHYFEHMQENGRFAASCDSYSLPENLIAHVDLIKPGVKDADVTGRTRRSRLHASLVRRGRDIQPHDDKSANLKPRQDKRSSVSGAGLKSRASTPIFSNATNLASCSEFVTPACIRALYGIPLADPRISVNPNNSLGIFEDDSLFFQPDLDRFFQDYTSVPVGTAPVVKSIDGGELPPAKPHGFGWAVVNGEANLDVQLAIPIIYPQTTTVFQTDDPYWSHYFDSTNRAGAFNTFLDGIDGSYCTYSAFNETGNSPLDPKYPDTNRTHGYKGQLQCGVYKPTNVISISYGSQENLIPFNYQRRQCNEWLKLALQGTTVLISSGDAGVGPCARKGRVYEVGMPDGCPWVTTVGATQIKPNHTINDREEAVSLNVAGFTSGGGFSMVFNRPDYQAAAVEGYFSTSNPPYPYFYNASFENNNGKYSRNGRGVPDLAAIGNDIVNSNQNVLGEAGGTSASAPIVAAIFNRIVEERLRVGKGPLGLVNPTIYQHPEAFHDIVKGSNPGPTCHGEGFKCSKGWDPVTGMGTPNYEALLGVFMALP